MTIPPGSAGRNDAGRIRKPPTAWDISRLLAAAGFDRAARVDQVGINHASPGYAVSADMTRSDAVRVLYCFEPEEESDTRRAALLARYAKAITEAGWTVETSGSVLIVTAGKPRTSPTETGEESR